MAASAVHSKTWGSQLLKTWLPLSLVVSIGSLLNSRVLPIPVGENNSRSRLTSGPIATKFWANEEMGDLLLDGVVCVVDSRNVLKVSLDSFMLTEAT